MATSRTTTKNAPAAPAPAPEVEYDFDNWDDAAEEAALAALAGRFKYVIVEGDFVGRFGDGTIVRLPLEFKAEVLDSFEGVDAPVDQLRAIFVALGDDASADVVLDQPLVQVATYASVYFELVQRTTEQAIAKLNRARLGE